MKVIFTLFGIFLIHILSLAQTKALREVEIDLGSRVFIGSEGIPFDVPFRIAGNIGPEYRKVTFKYRIKINNYESWMQFPSNIKDRWSEPVEWNAVDAYKPNDKFHLICGPLHPNVNYEFKFDIIKRPNITDPQKLELREMIFISITDFVDNIKSKDQPSIDNLNKELNNKAKVLMGPGAILKKQDFTDFDFKITDEPVMTFLKDAMDIKLRMNEASELIKGLAYRFKGIEYIELVDALTKLNEDSLNEKSREIWNGCVDISITEYKLLKFSELFKIIVNPINDLNNLINGKLKIDRAGFVPTTSVSLPSLSVFKSFFILLGNLKDNDGKNILNNETLNPFIIRFDQIINEYEQLNQAQEDKKNLLSKVPNILEDKYVELSYEIYDQPASDVVSSKNPYIGLDFGFVVLPHYGQVLFYDGVNFYFCPVNKDAPLRTFKGSALNMLSKMISVHIGLTQSIIVVNNKHYEPLIKDVGSILVGVGLRFNRVLRLNYGVMTFWEKNKNPLIDKRNLRYMSAISLTMDIDVASALGGLGKRLNITR